MVAFARVSWCRVLLGVCAAALAAAVQISQPGSDAVLSMNLVEERAELFEDEYWSGSCQDAGALQSPITLVSPFSFMQVDLKFMFREIDESYLSFRGRELRIEADFGQMSHNNKTFSSYMLVVKSPSEHAVRSHFTLPPYCYTNSAYIFPGTLILLSLY